MNTDVYWRMGYTAYPSKHCPHHSLSPEGQKWWAGWGQAGREANDRGRDRSLIACGDQPCGACVSAGRTWLRIEQAQAECRVQIVGTQGRKQGMRRMGRGASARRTGVGHQRPAKVGLRFSWKALKPSA